MMTEKNKFESGDLYTRDGWRDEFGLQLLIKLGPKYCDVFVDEKLGFHLLRETEDGYEYVSGFDVKSYAKV